MIVSNTITIMWDELSRAKRERLKRKLTFTLPDGNYCQCYREIPGVKLEIPRGAWHLVDLDYIDKRPRPKMPRLDFEVRLDDVSKDERFEGQSDAVEAIFQHEQGLIVRPPGTGKTQIALKFAADCETRSLVLVQTKDILDQWVEYAEQAIPGVNIGIIQGRREKIGHITIAMMQTIRNFIFDGRHDDDWWRMFGAVILDEAQHGAANSFEAVMNTIPAYYRVGFTASPTRADGMHPYLKHLIGPVIHKQKFSSPIDLKVNPLYTDFYYPYRGSFDWQRLINALISNEGRNEQIAEVIDREVAGGNSVLVLSRRIEHLDFLSELVQAENRVLVGQRCNVQQRRQILREFKTGRVPVLFATQLADEALDVPRCNRVVLAHPGKAEGRIIQQVGRALRNHPDKENARIIDVVDKKVRPLHDQWRERRRIYRKERISVAKRKLREVVNGN
jgi:superfamily II DNA or RNA helicase